ncbi:hypothetical protein VXS02_10705 [Photobacterium piscicola]|uniref:hypothetical protein n=1 Tax=Photobacterium piscicola TaxID=1378299 RepID=UPI002E1714E5|nr:hypothetical protein [Photobacterium piscicola]
MNKHQQSGMTTLLITSMLLIVALLFSLASYKNLFYQIKRTQNEVLARQAHWAAEGGLECGYSFIINENDKDTDISDCLDMLNYKLNSLSVVAGADFSSMVSISGFKTVIKSISNKSFESHGVIKSSADLYFKGSYSVFPDPYKEKTPNNWECIILRYKTNIYLHNDATTHIKNSQFEGAPTPPTEGFDIDSNYCHEDYKTISATKRSEFKNDITQNINMDIFKETFGVDRSKWNEVKDKYFIDSNTTGKTSCIDKINSSITPEKRHVWITGDCTLDDTDLKELPSPTSSEDGVFILVHNGILKLSGVSTYKAVIYHFNNAYTPSGSQWSGTVLDGSVYPDSYKTSDNDMLDAEEFSKRTVAYITGSQRPTGGFMFDTPNQVTYLEYSGLLNYDGKLINDLLSPFGEPKWIQGSWHDF